MTLIEVTSYWGESVFAIIITMSVVIAGIVIERIFSRLRK